VPTRVGVILGGLYNAGSITCPDLRYAPFFPPARSVTTANATETTTRQLQASSDGDQVG
jgi:hypothetical protein